VEKITALLTVEVSENTLAEFGYTLEEFAAMVRARAESDMHEFLNGHAKVKVK